MSLESTDYSKPVFLPMLVQRACDLFWSEHTLSLIFLLLLSLSFPPWSSLSACLSFSHFFCSTSMAATHVPFFWSLQCVNKNLHGDMTPAAEQLTRNCTPIPLLCGERQTTSLPLAGCWVTRVNFSPLSSVPVDTHFKTGSGTKHIDTKDTTAAIVKTTPLQTPKHMMTHKPMHFNMHVHTYSLKDHQYIWELSLWNTNCDYYRISMCTSFLGSCVWFHLLQKQNKETYGSNTTITPALIQTLCYHRREQKDCVPKQGSYNHAENESQCSSPLPAKLRWIFSSSRI